MQSNTVRRRRLRSMRAATFTAAALLCFQTSAQNGAISSPQDARIHGLESLRSIVAQEGVPLPNNLGRYVKDRAAAVRLGKALFWDMQVGSDGVQACATCHFHAGADNRTRNQVSPGILRVSNRRVDDVRGFFDAAAAPDGSFQTRSPDGVVTADDFPLVRNIQQLSEQGGVVGPAAGNSNDTVSSMGVFFTRFLGVQAGQALDSGERLLDPVFNANGATTRRVEPRNSPTTINAIFNYTNFWDGRANPVFNGQNPFGNQDPTAVIWASASNGKLRAERVSLQNASLASQAVGPGNSHFEMAFGDPDNGNMRTWPEIGRKLLGGNSPLVPLGKQEVAANDSVLSSLSAAPYSGLNTTYVAMIQAAFQDRYWGAQERVQVDNAAVARTTASMPTATVTTSATAAAGSGQGDNGNGRGAVTGQGAEAAPGQRKPNFSQMEANMAFFFGVSVMLYEATLVSDVTPFDRWMESGTLGGGFDQQALTGLNVFVGKGKCVNCHGGPEFTNASVRNAQNGRNVIEPMLMAQGTALYDNGFYNISVTPTSEDLGRGAKDLNGKPLAFSRQALFSRLGIDSFEFPIIGNTQIPAEDALGNPVCTDENGNGLCDPGEPIAPAFQRVTVDGAFKTPGLRNQALQGPYMHNGGLATLKQVVEFYNRGGNFCRHNVRDLDPDIVPLGMNDEEKAALVAFLVALTDDRVRYERAPFDHPQLFIPNGGFDESGARELPAVGAGGTANALQPFLGLDPQEAIFTPVGQCSMN